MATPGLSLVGFLDRDTALNLLRNVCVCPDPSEVALDGEWKAAVAKLGPPTRNAGYPDIQPVPADGQPHVSQLLHQPWVLGALQGTLAGAAIQMVELDPLLAFQFNVDLARSAHHNGGCSTPVSTPPTTSELFGICLPLNPVVENVRLSPLPNSVLITSKGLNFQALAQGIMQTPLGDFVGLQVGLSLPLVHVVRYNGRCYLHNGFHRAVGLRQRGVTHAPCIVRDVSTEAEVGIRSGYTFDLALLESTNPPTVAHLANGKAYDVNLKVFTRTLHISWADHITTED